MPRPVLLSRRGLRRPAFDPGSARAFTLVELMVAITAGLFVSIAAFALSRQGARFFQQEARIANAQYAATLGFDRLRADLARAGFMTTANVQRDPFRCGTTQGWPSPGMPSLAAIRIARATPTDVQDAENGLAPDQLTLTGSYSSVESFPVARVASENGEYTVTLEANTGAVARSNNGADGGGALADLFKAGRVLRLLDTTGHYEFAAIDHFDIDAGGRMVVHLKLNPPVLFKRDVVGGASPTCGVEGFGVGMLANVVNFIRYEIRNVHALNLAQYAPLYSPAATAPGDERRFELVRVELDSSGREMDGTLELVAEYAVDLRFGLSVATTSGVDPVLSRLPIGDARVYDYTGDVGAANGAVNPGPERIRAVRARLTVRSREGDRSAALPAPVGAPPGTILRYGLGGDGGTFARARTLAADVELPNLAGVAW